jgi:hypothetical protein
VLPEEICAVLQPWVTKEENQVAAEQLLNLAA